MMFLGSKKYSTIAALLAISLLFVANCKPKDEPFDEGKGSPVFFISGNVDGNPTQYIAGVDSYYMYSQYRYEPTDSVYWLEANLKKTGCTTCPKSIKISIADADESAGTGGVNIANVLKNDTFDYYPRSGVGTIKNNYKIDFFAEDSGFVNPQFNWDFGGAGVSAQKNPNFTFTDSQNRNVCLTITDLTTSCVKTSCNVIKIAELSNSDTCVPKFSYITLGDTAVQFFNQSGGGNYFWDFGDAQTSNQPSPGHVYGKKDTYKVCLTLSAGGCSQQICKTIVLGDTSFTCLANFNYGNTQKSTVATKPVQTSTVMVEYVDENGVLYQSRLQNQPVGSIFIKLSNRNYNPNEKGEKTQLVNISFKCRVFNGSGGFKDITVTNGVVAVAYP